MHYKKLIEAHKLFYGGYEHRAPYYDNYMKGKNLDDWTIPKVPIGEISKLFRFIRSWDRFFQGDKQKFQQIYGEIYSSVKDLKDQRIEDSDLNDEELKKEIRDIFDKVANCTTMDRYESTDASKILHTILPNFIVMWDDEIKDRLVGGRRMGATYSFQFLPKVQTELQEAIRTCMEEKGFDRVSAIEFILEQCDGKTLAKLADEYNYMRHTKQHPYLR